MLAGEAACQDTARLRHIERIECPQHGDVQEMVAAFGNLRPYAVFFIAEDEQGGGMQAGGEGVEAAFAERGPVDEESRVPRLIQRPGDVHDLGDRKAFQRPGCGAARPGPQKGAVVTRDDQPGTPHCVQGSGEGSGIAGVLHLIKHEDERQGGVRSGHEHIGELGEAGLEKPGDDALMPGGAKPIKALGIRKRKTDFSRAAQIEDAIRILRAFALADKDGINAFRFPFEKFQNRLDPGEDGLLFFRIGTGSLFKRSALFSSFRSGMERLAGRSIFICNHEILKGCHVSEDCQARPRRVDWMWIYAPGMARGNITR